MNRVEICFKKQTSFTSHTFFEIRLSGKVLNCNASLTDLSVNFKGTKI